MRGAWQTGHHVEHAVHADPGGNSPELLGLDVAGDVDENGFVAAAGVDDHQRDALDAALARAARGWLHEDANALAALVHANHGAPAGALERSRRVVDELQQLGFRVADALVDADAHIGDALEALAQFSSRPISAANVWGFLDLNDNREYAVVGLRNGTAIVEVTDPAAPREVATIPGNSSPWREVKVYQLFDAGANRWRAFAYVATEAANSGIQVIDMSGLPLTAGLASTNLDTSSQHTLYVANIDYATNAALPGMTPVLYVAGSNVNGGSWRAYSLANPAFPQHLGSAPTTRYMHDSASFVVTDARTAQCAPGHNPCEVLVDFNVEAVELWDVTNKTQPVLLGTGTNPNNRYIHSGWPTANATRRRCRSATPGRRRRRTTTAM